MSTQVYDLVVTDDSDVTQRVAHLHRSAPEMGCRALCGYVFPERRTVPRFDLPTCQVCAARKRQASWVACDVCGEAA